MLHKVEFKKVREFGEIINDLFIFIRQNFKPLIKSFIYLCGIFMIAGMVAVIMQQLNMQKMISGNVNPSNPFGLSGMSELFTWHYFLAIAISMINYTAITVTGLSYVAIYIDKGNLPPTVEEVWGYFRYYFLRVFASSIPVSLFLVICLIACVVPGLYVFPAMSLFFAVMIFENGTFSYAFGRAFKLVKDQWWSTAAALLIIWVITYATMTFVSLPAIVLTLFSAFTEGAGRLSTATIILSTFIQHICQIFLLVPLIGVSLIYFNLAERQESGGLFDRIHNLGEKKDDFNAPQEY